MTYLDEFSQSIKEGNLAKILHLWEEYCAGEGVDTAEFEKVLDILADSDVAEALGKYVEMGLPLWSTIEEGPASHHILRRILDIQTTNSQLLADTAYQFLDKCYHDDKYFNLKIALVGLRDKRRFQGAITNFELLSHMSKGKFVYHNSGWGVGEIMEISLVREQVVVEFENVAGQRHITFESAFNTLVALDTNHFLAQRFADPDAFEELARKDPVGVMHQLLHDLGPKNAAEIKEELSELVIPEKDWAKWWQTTRTKLKKDPKIITPSTIREPFGLREEEVPLEERLANTLKDAKTAQKSLIACYNVVRDLPEVLRQEALKDRVIEKIISSHKSASAPLKLQAATFLENLCHHTIEGQSMKELIENEQDFEKTLEQFDVVALKRKTLEAVREYRKDWETLFASLILNTGPNTLKDYMLKELLGNKDLLSKSIKKLLDLPTEYPETFIWYFQKVIKGGDIPFNDKKNIGLFFENFLVLYHYLEIMPDWRDTVKKMYALLSASRWKLVRNILDGASLEYVKEFLLLSSKCLTMSKQDQSVLRSLAEVAQPSLAQASENETDNVLWTTQEGYNKTHERVRIIGEEEMVDNAKEIEAARALGDLRENAEYKFALERRSRLQAELKMLSDQLQMARILSPQDITAEEVSVGMIVDLESNNGQKIRYSILGPWDADPDNNILSFKSKFAQTMIGHHKGDTLSFNGDEYKVVNLTSFFER